MDKQFMPGGSPDEIQIALRNSADKIRSGEYYNRPLTDAEEQAKKEILLKQAKVLRKLEEQKKDFMDEWKANRKPELDIYNTVITELSNGQVEVYGDLFDIINAEDGTMETYNEHGELVDTRKLRPNEKKDLNLFRTGRNSKMFVPGSNQTDLKKAAGDE